MSVNSNGAGPVFLTPEALEVELGGRLRALRLERNLDQATLAARAGVSLNALKHLEGGRGSTLKTLVSVLRALDRVEWLNTIAPIATINPLTMPRAATPRQRATARRKKKAAHGA
jgi:transcriptional regulator with XRE-family HTH domain